MILLMFKLLDSVTDIVSESSLNNYAIQWKDRSYRELSMGVSIATWL